MNMVIVHQVYITEVGYASDRLLTVMGPMLMVLDCSNRGGELRISPQNRSCLCTATWAAMRPPYTLQKRQNDINNARKMRYIIMGQVCACSMLPNQRISIPYHTPIHHGASMAHMLYIASHSNHEARRGVSAILSIIIT